VVGALRRDFLRRGGVRYREELADADYARARSASERTRKAIDEAKQNIQVLRQELEKMPQ
jgi:hypothetical protein